MRLLDSARGAYARAPHWVRASVGPVLSLAPQSLKLGRRFREVRADIRRSETDPDFVARFQLARLRDIARACAAHSEFYQRVFRGTFGGDVNPDTFTVEDLRRLPVLDKDQLRGAPEKLLVVPRSQVDLGTTSGSSGEPLAFFLDKDRSVWEWAFKTHLWSKVGYQLGDRTGVLRGTLIPRVDDHPWEWEHGLRELRMSPFHLVPGVMDRYLDLVDRYKVRFLQGYPSAMDILARHAKRVGWRRGRTLRGALPFSETLFPHQRENIHDAFGVPVYPFYGLSEKVVIAGEVLGAPEVYEFEPLYGFAELVKENGEPVRQIGDSGRVVGTGLMTRGMPLLRYDTGDVAVLAQLPTHENCHRLRVSGIRARRSLEFLVASSGALLSTTAINVHSDSYLAMAAFQFFQDTPGVAVIRAVPAPGKTGDDIRGFVEEIQRKIGSGMRFELALVAELPSRGRGKRLMIDQRIPLSAGGVSSPQDRL